MNIGIYKSPIGNIHIEAEKEYITKISFTGETEEKESESETIIKCKAQLDEYFKGKRQKFELKYKFRGTEFQCKVWEELSKIPYGKVVSYKYIAEKMEKPKGVRAVANAIGKNNLIIVIPCHRVIGNNGKLTGFSAKTDDKTGLEIKKELLEIEGILSE